MAQDLTPARVKQLLETARYGRSLSLRESTGSTNDDARADAMAGAVDGHVVIAETQTKGRGSRGRAWVSPPGVDLYLSIVAEVPVTMAQLPPLTLAVGVAVAETVEAFLPSGEFCSRAQVKWPNDVWVDRHKCAGTLVESASVGERRLPVIIGIGLNVNRRSFPEGLDTPPTSIALAAQRAEDLDRAAVLAKLLQQVERWVDRFVTFGVSPVVQAAEERLALRGERARCDEVEGIVVGLSPEGALSMRTDHGLQTVLAGTLRPL